VDYPGVVTFSGIPYSPAGERSWSNGRKTSYLQDAGMVVMQDPEPKLPPRDPDPDPLNPVPGPNPDDPDPDVVPQIDPEIPQPQMI